MSEWISVKDRLPEREKYYLGWGKSLNINRAFHMCIVLYSDNVWIKNDNDEEILVIYWQPLPERPEDG